MTADPHAAGRVLRAGSALAEARGAVILLHGRGGSADDILGLSHAFKQRELAFLAPEAAGSSWYPQSFMAPRALNEPWLSSALRKVESLVSECVASGVPRERIVLGGFSQGACLSTEFVASYPARYGGLIAFTGGLIGPEGSDLGHAGDLSGTPALLLSGDPDPHVPFTRVEDSAAELRRMGADVTVTRYPGRPHTVSADEIERARHLLDTVFGDM